MSINFIVVLLSDLILTNWPLYNFGRLVLKKTLFFCLGEYAEYGCDQQGLIWYVFRLWNAVFS